jgi:hypothetical protein
MSLSANCNFNGDGTIDQGELASQNLTASPPPSCNRYVIDCGGGIQVGNDYESGKSCNVPESNLCTASELGASFGTAQCFITNEQQGIPGANNGDEVTSNCRCIDCATDPEQQAYLNDTGGGNWVERFACEGYNPASCGHTLNVQSTGASNVPINATPITYSGTTGVDYPIPGIPGGENITLQAPGTSGGFFFARWDTCPGIESGDQCIMTVNSDVTAVAKYSSFSISSITAENPPGGLEPVNDVDVRINGIGGIATGPISIKIDCRDGGNNNSGIPHFSGPLPVGNVVYDLCDYNSAGTYTVTATGTREFASDTKKTSVVVNPNPPVFEISATNLDFGEKTIVPPGNPTDLPLIISNVGGGSFSVDTNPSISDSNFLCSSQSCVNLQNIPAGGSVQYNVTFAPYPTGVKTGNLTFTGSWSQGTQVVTLNGTGILCPKPLQADWDAAYGGFRPCSVGNLEGLPGDIDNTAFRCFNTPPGDQYWDNPSCGGSLPTCDWYKIAGSYNGGLISTACTSADYNQTLLGDDNYIQCNAFVQTAGTTAREYQCTPYDEFSEWDYECICDGGGDIINTPIVDLYIEGSKTPTVNQGTEVTISWPNTGSPSLDSCQGVGPTGWAGPKLTTINGSELFDTSSLSLGTHDFKLWCVNGDGSDEDTVPLTITATPAPTITFDPILPVDYGTRASLTWNVVDNTPQGTVTCSVEGPNGQISTALSGTNIPNNVDLEDNADFTITCNNGLGLAYSSATSV